MLHRLRTRRDLDPLLLHDAACVLHERRRDITIPLNLALPQTSWRILREGPANLVEAGLLAAGTRIEHEDFHLFDGCALVVDYFGVGRPISDGLGRTYSPPLPRAITYLMHPVVEPLPGQVCSRVALARVPGTPNCCIWRILNAG